MKLPFLKSKRLPRIKNPEDNRQEELVQGPEDDIIDHYVSNELIKAMHDKDVPAFLAALEALVINAFDYDEDTNG